MNKCLAISIIIFIGLGCNMLDRLKEKKENTKDNGKITETIEKQTPNSESDITKTENTKTSDKKDYLSIGSGAYLVSVSSSYTPGEPARWSAFGLIDENPKVGWASKTNTVTDQTIVFELPTKTTLKTIGFDTAGVDTEGSAAKDVSVEISDVSATDGFETILTKTLRDQVDGQDFPVEKEVAGRFVKINAKNNFGAKDWLEIMEVRGYGDQEPLEPFEKNISGTYKSQFGDFHIKQEGTSIVGCYGNDDGLFEGGLDGKIMTLTWKETGDTDQDTGPAVFLFDSDAKKFVGLWAYRNDDYYVGKWDGEKISDEVGSCPQYKGLSDDNATGNKIEEELKKDGRAVIYGINFDFNSEKIKEESKQTLNQIVGVLKENTDWRMTIEGHTDNIGGESFNQTLSEKRANSVKKYLSDVGIDESRLTAKGVGLSNPVAKNETEAGRARNRRVELVKE